MTGADAIRGAPAVRAPHGAGPDAQRDTARRNRSGARVLVVPGMVGLAGSGLVLLGSVQAGSPFVEHSPASWFFTAGPAPHAHTEATTQFVGILLVYAGMALMLVSWWEVWLALRRGVAPPVRALVRMLVAWSAPLVVAPPLFSRDVYSYAAQGALVARGVNPYLHGVGALGRGPFTALVDPLWRHSPAPYGPAWERLSGWIVEAAGHDVLATVVAFRLVALLGVALMAWGLPALARTAGSPASSVFTLGVLNPLVLLVLVGGAHNDALMLGLLVAGCVAARRGHHLVGLALCAVAAEVKAPAVMGALYIGWWWAGTAAPWRTRVTRVLGAVALGAALMAGAGAAAGLGWRWLSAVATSGAVVSWLDPSTAVGLGLWHGARLLGDHGGSAAFVHGARGAGIGVALCISLAVLVRSKRPDELPALGWSMLALAALGPVVWPWYETWGTTFLALSWRRWVRGVVLALSAVACFADVPSPRLLVDAPPAVVAVGWSLLVGGVCLTVVARGRRWAKRAG